MEDIYVITVNGKVRGGVYGLDTAKTKMLKIACDMLKSDKLLHMRLEHDGEAVRILKSYMMSEETKFFIHATQLKEL